jgi:NAD(P)-dependent dehydrogenase (short-subunit alcohol dehydrogenase family)
MQNYLIIGASSGIGLQTALQLSTQHKVYGTYSKTSVEGSANLSYHFVNVLDEQKNLDFLPETIDGVVYCPGSINLKPFARIKPEDFVQDYQLQVVGAIKIIQAILPKLKVSTHASIVLFSTVAVQTGLNFHSQVAASKGAIEGLTKALAAEFAPTIRVNCIAPSLTNTPLAGTLLNTPEKIEANAQRHPLKKIGQPADIANMVEFLLSDKSSWVTGQVLHIDGGMGALRV